MLCGVKRVEYTRDMKKTPTPDRTYSHSWQSRYGSLRTLTHVADGVYILEGHTRFCRGGGDPNTEWKMVDFEGGPYMTTGSVVGSELHISCDSQMFTENTVITGLDFITRDAAAELFGRDPVLLRDDENYKYLKITTTERNTTR